MAETKSLAVETSDKKLPEHIDLQTPPSDSDTARMFETWQIQRDAARGAARNNYRGLLGNR
ncbi:hypothetical protein COU78_06420 [Candidatus Peregrinibacteria bacterium CG10_big_fil_rev_8_21_14_0_10_49_24]|nr:MAG: hypothetical protein COU78_06420 [Candidatus Peregrinibacteria bacterium CG10_big_fil_rev_8_21_14_0_10_49_24]